MIRISELTVLPEKYASEIFDELPEAAKSLSFMLGDINRRFISGLIRLCKPKNVLEVGVAYGGGTSVILNAVRDLPETKVVSIDRIKAFAPKNESESQNGENEIGYIAKKLYPKEYESGKAKLYTGVDPSEIMESIGGKFDFVVLDTMHVHPIETLNFLSFYPFLTEDAVIVLDDVMLQFQNPGLCATRLLFNSIVADKYTLGKYNIVSQNVAAFQLNPDTPKYIDDLFRALYMNWYVYTADVFSVRKIVEKYYSEKQLQDFDLATAYNENYLALLNFNKEQTDYNKWVDDTYEQAQRFAASKCSEKMRKKLNPLKKNDIYFYCAGKCTQFALKYFTNAGLTEFLPKGIFDQNFENIEPIRGIPVIKPDFSKLNGGDLVVVALFDESEAEKIVKIIKAAGFSNVCTVQSLGLPINFIL
jgi:predicted O-methyltransferase YrrM